MKNYIATFFTHYDSLMFFGQLKEKGVTAKLMPVPRKVSASCGTGCFYVSDFRVEISDCEVEAVYVEEAGVFSKVWSSEDSEGYYPGT